VGDTLIDWAKRVWNPATGCDPVSRGCDLCYAADFAHRFPTAFPDGFNVTLHPDRLRDPFTWRRPGLTFVDSQGDLLHDSVPDAYLAAVWAVMYWTGSDFRNHAATSLRPAQTFMVLTKRHARMRSWIRTWSDRDKRVALIIEAAAEGWCNQEDIEYAPFMPGCLGSVWLGVSTEDQKTANLRIPALLATPAALRFISAEPLLGPIDLRQAVRTLGSERGHGLAQSFVHTGGCCNDFHGLGLVITGGESGPTHRPPHPDWFRSLQQQCADAKDVTFFFKQWGAFAPHRQGQPLPGRDHPRPVYVSPDGQVHNDPTTPPPEGSVPMARYGKRRGGHLLDGVAYRTMPPVHR
jgi:protein gp37